MSQKRYPDTKPGMTIEDFRGWTVSQLKEFLGDRGINKDGLKEKLVKNVYGAYTLALPVDCTDLRAEQEEVNREYKEKLILDGGMVNLPAPRQFVEGWVNAPLNIPNTTYGKVENYLRDHDAGKAFKGGKSLLVSGHMSNVMTHNIRENLRYCFMRGVCCPEQKVSKGSYDVWLCLHKDTGNIINGNCLCTAGSSGICKHAGALMWYIENEVRLGNNRTCTSKKQQWSVP